MFGIFKEHLIGFAARHGSKKDLAISEITGLGLSLMTLHYFMIRI